MANNQQHQGGMQGQQNQQYQQPQTQQGQGAMQTGTQQGMEPQRRAGPNVGVLRPPVDVIEDASGITLIADMPGVSKDNLSLRLEAQSLTIEGSLSLDLPAGMESRFAEVRHQHYERSFALSRELDGEKATAELAHGVLTVHIPKTAEAAPRKIEVNTKG
jgi:HSP20 family protein